MSGAFLAQLGSSGDLHISISRQAGSLVVWLARGRPSG